MQYRMRSQISGTRNGVDWPRPGETIDVDGDEAKQLLGMGVIEAATAPESETADVKTTPRRRSRRGAKPDPEPTGADEPPAQDAAEAATAPESETADA